MLEKYYIMCIIHCCELLSNLTHCYFQLIFIDFQVPGMNKNRQNTYFVRFAIGQKLDMGHNTGIKNT